jgi:hypothetical protein
VQRIPVGMIAGKIVRTAWIKEIKADMLARGGVDPHGQLSHGMSWWGISPVPTRSMRVMWPLIPAG